MSHRLSIHMEQISSHWTDFHGIRYIYILEHLLRIFKFHLNLTRVTGTLHWDSCTFVIISHWILLRLRNVSDRVCKEIVIIKSFYSLWSIGHPWRASRRCGLQLCPWPCSMIFLCFLSHPLLSFATFSSACFSCIPEDSNLMQFSLLLLFLYVMCVQSSSIL